MSYKRPRKDNLVIDEDSDYEILPDDESSFLECVTIDSPDPGPSHTELAQDQATDSPQQNSSTL